MIEQTVEELTPVVGTRPACRALGAAPATIYRRRRPPEPRPKRPRPVPARALSAAERQAVLELLHSERFVDSSPAQVWATLLDEGRYLACERTMYRLLAAHHGSVRERRDHLTHPPYAPPELLAERPNQVWSWDISKLKGPGEMDPLLPLRDLGRLQPLRRRLDRPAPRELASRQGADRPGL
jgi:putative transposase